MTEDRIPSITTERLLLRPWRDGDREPFAVMNADPEVTRYLSRSLTRAESDAMIERVMTRWAERG